MQNLTLPNKLPSGKSWTEEAPPGLHQRSTGSFGSDFGQQVLNIKINGAWSNIRSAIRQIVGYSECVSTTTGVPFNPGNPAAQGPYRLKRIAPARHPTLPGLRATKILNAQGVSFNKTVGGGAGGVYIGDGHVANWEYFYLSILFEIPIYPIIDDDEMNIVRVVRGTEVNSQLAEYVRYTTFEVEENFETLARKGVTWNACDAKAFAVSKVFPGDRFARTPKMILKVTTYDVHQDYLMLGRLVPTNSFRRLSMVNSLAFPQDAYRDQNKTSPGNVVQFGPGTLLMLPSKTQFHAQCHPVVLSGILDLDYFPRTQDVERRFVVFDPATDDGTTIDLSAAKYGPGGGATSIRGHQLAPLPQPSSTGYLYYAFRNKTSNPAAAAGNPASDRELLYEYANFEALWACVESLS